MRCFKKLALAIATAIIPICALMATGINASTPDSTRQGAIGEFSLLTCSPGSEIYELFGHTAIRYHNPDAREDIVFNYGMFSFNTPNFIWRFVKGETDYQLGVTRFEYFWPEYHYRGSYVYEQKLNLPDSLKARLLISLFENYEPQNRIYRYNFFYDNCTTRARDMIERATGQNVIYEKEVGKTSFRKIIHKFTKGHEWSRLGMDICIGSEADKTLNEREAMFAPLYYMDFLNHAYIISSDGGKTKLAKEPQVIVTPGNGIEEEDMPSPMLVFAMLFVLTVIVSALELKVKRTLWGYDIILFGGTGLCGLIIAFLVFFSTHPATSPNYMLIFMHPLHLLLLPAFIYKEAKGRQSIYHMANSVVIALFFILIFIIPQDFNNAILFLALSLLLRSICYTLRTKYKKLITG